MRDNMYNCNFYHMEKLWSLSQKRRKKSDSRNAFIRIAILRV